MTANKTSPDLPPLLALESDIHTIEYSHNIAFSSVAKINSHTVSLTHCFRTIAQCSHESAVFSHSDESQLIHFPQNDLKVHRMRTQT